MRNLIWTLLFPMASYAGEISVSITNPTALQRSEVVEIDANGYMISSESVMGLRLLFGMLIGNRLLIS